MTNDIGAAPQATGNGNGFFGWMRGLGITREPGWIGGVSAGLALRLGIDAVIVRGIIVVIAVLGGPALLLYAAAWMLLPDSTGRIHLEELLRGIFDKAIVGIGVMLLLALMPVARGFWSLGSWYAGAGYTGPTFWGLLWTVAFIGGAIWLIVWLANRSNSSSPSAPNPWTSDSPNAYDYTATSASFVASGATATSGAATAAPEAPSAPAANAADEDLAAWKQRQAAWKHEHDAWRQQQAASEREQQRQRLAEQRRLRQEEAAERRLVQQEHQRLTRSHPVYSLVAIGLALVAGAATALVVVELPLSIESKMVAALCASLVVLAMAIVINGFRGKRSGGSSGVAVLVVIALLATGVSGWVRGPLLSERTIDWQPSWASADTERVVLVGDVVLDLEEYFDDAPAGRDAGDPIALFVLAGDVKVIMPADADSTVSVEVAAGSVRLAGEPVTDEDAVDVRFDFDARGTAVTDTTVVVNIEVGAGDVTISQAK